MCCKDSSGCESTGDDAETLDLPSAEALLASTVALMTAWADPCPQARLPAAQLRRLLARKVVSNLFFLQHHPRVAPGLRQVLSQAHAHWDALAQAPAGDAALAGAGDVHPAALHLLH